jgi:hypothetical protein
MSIMPLLITAPIKTPIAATKIIFLKDAARAPTAEFKKFTASLLTPTDKSKIANTKRNIIMHKNNMSMSLFVILFAKDGLYCFITIS